MNEKVRDFIARETGKKENEQQAYRRKVLLYAGLYEYTPTEVSHKEYKSMLTAESDLCYKAEGRYFIRKRTPIPVTEEEFAAVENAIPDRELNRLREDGAAPEPEYVSGKNWVSSFFTFLAAVLFVAGIITTLMMLENPETNKPGAIILNILQYILYTLFAACAADVSTRIEMILRLLQ